MRFETTWGVRLLGMDEGWRCDAECPTCRAPWSIFPEDVDGQEQAADHAGLMFSMLGACSECRAKGHGQQDGFFPPPPVMNRADRRAADRRHRRHHS